MDNYKVFYVLIIWDTGQRLFFDVSATDSMSARYLVFNQFPADLHYRMSATITEK